jgi:DNA topoisomerase-1
MPLVENQTQIDYPVIALGSHPGSGAPVNVRIGRFGPYVQVGEGDEAKNASVPDEVPPADFTLDLAIELVETRARGPHSLGPDPATGLDVYVMSGRFGPYVQLGETPEKGSDAKPRRASLTAADDPASLTLERALELLALPRLVGHDPEAGEDIVANFGRYGPYIKRGSEFRSLETDADVFSVTLEAAIELFRREKPSRRSAGPRVLRELGAHPESAAAVRLLDGRYGPYVSDGTTNASLPKDADPEAVTLEEALAMLKAREGIKPARRSRSGGGRGGTSRSTRRRTPARKPRA